MTSTTTTSQRVDIPVPAGGRISGTLRVPVSGRPVAALALHPATAVPERLYSGFAEYLAGSGLAVVSHDYRGTGASGKARAYRSLRMRDWMQDDVPAVTAWLREGFSAVPQFAVGHSIGGHALALGLGGADLAGFVAVASHAGVTATIESRVERLRVAAMLNVIGPLAARGLGYVPGRRLSLGEDLPGAAMLEWNRWSRSPQYFFDDPSMRASERAAEVTTEALVLGFSDDPWASPAQIDAIFSRLTRATVERRTYTPADGAVAAIGHLGFFRRGLRYTLWGEVRQWLLARA